MFRMSAIVICNSMTLDTSWCLDGRAGGRGSGRQVKVCPGCISETLRCRKLIRGRDIG